MQIKLTNPSCTKGSVQADYKSNAKLSARLLRDLISIPLMCRPKTKEKAALDYDTMLEYENQFKTFT